MNLLLKHSCSIHSCDVLLFECKSSDFPPCNCDNSVVLPQMVIIRIFCQSTTTTRTNSRKCFHPVTVTAIIWKVIPKNSKNASNHVKAIQTDLVLKTSVLGPDAACSRIAHRQFSECRNLHDVHRCREKSLVDDGPWITH